ncbi:hypothetical protein HK101_001031 [Irineochytrium annulatum]|nr:hypothetical protein HK101_001031 [Irineochytrium annulatum]
MESHQAVDPVDEAIEYVGLQELLDQSLNLGKQQGKQKDQDDDDDDDDSTLAKALLILERADHIENKILAGENGAPVVDATLLRWSSVVASYKSMRKKCDGAPSVEGDASGNGCSFSSAWTSIIDLDTFGPMPVGVAVPENPRKAFGMANSFIVEPNALQSEAAQFSMDWGYYKEGITSMTSLAKIGFVPAKLYLNPSTTPLRNPSAALHVALHVASMPNEPLSSAMPWFLKAAEGGYAAAQLELAKRVFASNPGEAMAWMHRSWNRSDAGEAMVWLHKAWIGNPSAEAAFLIGCVFYQGFHATSVSGSSTAAEENGTEGTARQNGVVKDGSGGSVPWHLVDLDVAKGRSVARDPVAAALWFARAADRGHLGGHAAIGEIRLAGLDRQPPNPTLAVKHIAEAAGSLKDDDNVKHTIPRAMYVLGQCLQQGVGTGKDEALAAEWLKKAGELGFGADEAAVSIGGGADDKKMSETDLLRAAKGVQMLREAAVQGIPRAMYVLGLCLKRGIGTERDEEEGEDWMKKATECGFMVGSVDSVEPSSTLIKTEDSVADAKPTTGANAIESGSQKGESDLLAAAATTVAQSMCESTLHSSVLSVDPVERLAEPPKAEEDMGPIVVSANAPSALTATVAAEASKWQERRGSVGTFEEANAPSGASVAAEPSRAQEAPESDGPLEKQKAFGDFPAKEEDVRADTFATMPIQSLHLVAESFGEVVEDDIMARPKQNSYDVV